MTNPAQCVTLIGAEPGMALGLDRLMAAAGYDVQWADHENMLWHDPDDHPTYSQVVEAISATSSRASPARAARRTRVPLTDAKDSFIAAMPSFGASYGNGTYDRAVADTFPASDPTAGQEPGSHARPRAGAAARRRDRHARAHERGRGD